MKRTSDVFTRRELAASVAAVAVTGAGAQTQPAAAPPDELGAARAQHNQNSAALRKFSVPTLLEPSFAFRP